MANPQTTLGVRILNGGEYGQAPSVDRAAGAAIQLGSDDGPSLAGLVRVCDARPDWGGHQVGNLHSRVIVFLVVEFNLQVQ